MSQEITQKTLWFRLKDWSVRLQVRWQGHDAEGRPLLVIRLARACKECKSHRIATFVEAIVSQVQPLVWWRIDVLMQQANS